MDVLKVDRSFVGRLGRDAKGRALVCAVMDLARALGLAVVAEGVETAEQAEELARLGCKVAQGYHFARPFDPEEVSEFLLARPQLLRPVARRPGPAFTCDLPWSGPLPPAQTLWALRIKR